MAAVVWFSELWGVVNGEVYLIAMGVLDCVFCVLGSRFMSSPRGGWNKRVGVVSMDRFESLWCVCL